jgi:DNA-binding MarR family transcriptional regulator
MISIDDKRLPLGRLLWQNGRLYFGALHRKLDQLEIERYFSALIMIENEYPHTSQQEIADHLGINKATMVRILNYLTHHGYIIREFDGSDKRKHRICLTTKATSRMPRIYKAVKELNDACAKNVRKEEWKIFLKVLNQVEENLVALPSRELVVHFRTKKESSNPQIKKRLKSL